MSRCMVCNSNKDCYDFCGKSSFELQEEILELRAENERLEKWKSETLYHIPHIDIHKSDCRKELSNLKTENEKLKKCIEFYANTSHYGVDQAGRSTAIDPCDHEDFFHQEIGVSIRGGKLARQILKELKEGKK